MSSKIKKDPENQWVFAKKLLKIIRVILIVAVIFYLSYALLQKPLSVFGDDFIGEIINLFSPLVFLYCYIYLFIYGRLIGVSTTINIQRRNCLRLLKSKQWMIELCRFCHSFSFVLFLGGCCFGRQYKILWRNRKVKTLLL